MPQIVVSSEDQAIRMRAQFPGVDVILEGQAHPKLGDKIERIAKPIAQAIDKVARTKIAGCGGCKKMKERLNAGMPITEALKLRIQGK